MAEQCWTDWWWFWMMLGGWSHSAIRWNRSHEQVMPGYFRNHQHQPENCFFLRISWLPLRKKNVEHLNIYHILLTSGRLWSRPLLRFCSKYWAMSFLLRSIWGVGWEFEGVSPDKLMDGWMSWETFRIEVLAYTSGKSRGGRCSNKKDDVGCQGTKFGALWCDVVFCFVFWNVRCPRKHECMRWRV